MFNRATLTPVVITLVILAVAAQTSIGQKLLGVQANSSWFG